jgi:hypothetical protein
MKKKLKKIQTTSKLFIQLKVYILYVVFFLFSFFFCCSQLRRQSECTNINNKLSLLTVFILTFSYFLDDPNDKKREASKKSGSTSWKENVKFIDFDQTENKEEKKTLTFYFRLCFSKNHKI